MIIILIPGILPGDGYFSYIDDVFIGGFNKGELPNFEGTKRFIGYLQNFHIGDVDIFNKLSSAGFDFSVGGELPSLIFNDVTFPNYNSYVQLPPLNQASGLNVHFLFKTHNPNGVILLNEGLNGELFAVELFQGKLHVKVSMSF